MFVRTVKVPSGSGEVKEYVRIVESYREHGKVKQRVIANLGPKHLLQEMLPNLERVLRGTSLPRGIPGNVLPLQAWNWGPVLAVRRLFDELGLWTILDRRLPRPKKREAPHAAGLADRVFALVANRLIRPGSEHALAWWLETDFVCDRHARRFVPQWRQQRRVRVDFRQLQRWYRTLDRLIAAKGLVEIDLYTRLRDLFSLQPELVLFDITSTYFEGRGPDELARFGYSRDGKTQNVQVVVGLVLAAGWPIAHHVWQGNRNDVTTVPEVFRDLVQRFGFRRVILVGDRGMVSEHNLRALEADGHGYLVGLRRRQNAQLDGWLQSLDESKWVDVPLGTSARERKTPWRTRVQEVPTEAGSPRVFVIDSEERRHYEQAKREQARERTRRRLEQVRERVAAGRLQTPEAIAAAAERALRASHGYRYYTWSLQDGVFTYSEHPVNWPREQRLEGRYVIATSERELDMLDAVAHYKELMEVERSFRSLKDVLGIRPIYHQCEQRVRGHIFVTALALLVQRMLERRLSEAKCGLSAADALRALETVRLVEFEVDGQKRRGVTTGSPQARQVLSALGITKLDPPDPPAGPAEAV